MNFKTFPILHTERLVLNQLSKDDVDEIFYLRSDDEIGKYLDHPRAQSKLDAQNYITKIIKGITNSEWIMWAIRLNDKKRLIGTICLWNFSDDELTADIGFILHSDFQGMGYMSECVDIVIKFGFEKLELSRIMGEVDPSNSKSIKLLLQKGFEIAWKEPKTNFYKLIGKN